MITPDMPNTSSMSAAGLGSANDARMLMLFGEQDGRLHARGFSLAIGYFGAHEFYLGCTGIAVTQFLITLTILGIAVNFFWVLIDAILIPGRVRSESNMLAWRLGAACFAA